MKRKVNCYAASLWFYTSPVEMVKNGKKLLFHNYTHYIQTDESHFLRSTLSLWKMVPSCYVFEMDIMLLLLYVFFRWFLVDKVSQVKKGMSLQSLTD